MWKRVSMFRLNIMSSIKSQQKLRRQFSGGNNSHGHNDSHSTPHFEPYPDQAYPFGRKPGSPLEGWEWITFSVYAAIIMIAFKRTFIDEKKDDIKSWARREYLAREQAVENGEEIEFGKWYYKNASYDADEVDQIPKLQD